MLRLLLLCNTAKPMQIASTYVAAPSAVCRVLRACSRSSASVVWSLS